MARFNGLCNAHVMDWIVHVYSVGNACWDKWTREEGAVVAMRRAPNIEYWEACARNEAAWREITAFLSSEPRRDNAGALAPAGRS